MQIPNITWINNPIKPRRPIQLGFGLGLINNPIKPRRKEDGIVLGLGMGTLPAIKPRRKEN